MNNVSVALEPNGRVMIVTGISQTLRRYQGNNVMACEKRYIWIVKCMKISMNGLNLFSLASDHGISGIMPYEVSKTCFSPF